MLNSDPKIYVQEGGLELWKCMDGEGASIKAWVVTRILLRAYFMYLKMWPHSEYGARILVTVSVTPHSSLWSLLFCARPQILERAHRPLYPKAQK